MDPNGHAGPAHLSVVTSVAVPFAGDRPFWAARLRDAGVAGYPVDGRSSRPAALARGIEFAERAGVRRASVRLARPWRRKTAWPPQSR